MAKMQRGSLAVFMAVVLWMTGFVPGAAQDQSGGQQSMLPEIDPQDIEIRSDFTARFPGLRRQPILGFEPARDAYQLDPNRMPYLESEQERMANPPITSLTRPDPPHRTPYQYPSKHRLWSRFGVGTYLSGIGEGYLEYELSRSTAIGASFDYASSDGYLDRSSSYRDLDASLDIAARLGSNTKLDVFGGIENDFNYMPDWEPGTPVAYSDNLRKSQLGYRIGARVENWKNSLSGWKLEARYRRNDYELDASTLDGTNSSDVISAHFKKQWIGNKVRTYWTVFADGHFGSQEDATGSSNTWNTVEGGLSYTFPLNTYTRVKAGSGVAYTGDTGGNNSFYVLPRVSIEHWVAEPFKVKAELRGDVEQNGLDELNERNRYVGLYPSQKHTYLLEASGEARFELFAQSAIWVGASWKHGYDYAYFRRSTNGVTNALGPYDIRYGGADVRTVYAGLSHDLIPDVFWLEVEGFLKGHDVDGLDAIPFKEQLGLDINGSLRYESFTLDVWARISDDRFDPDHNEDLKAYANVGTRVQYQWSPLVGFYVQGNNILDQRYEIWQGYREAPLQLYGGVVLKL